MAVPVWLWFVTIGGFVAIIAFDFVLVSRNPHEPSLRESALWVAFYVALAALFGLGLLVTAGSRYSGEFFAGWITEYSLSMDNLFVFVLIFGAFGVPKKYRQKVLLVGIALALVLRGAFIAVGAELISRFDWIFYVFGAFLIITAWKLIRPGGDETEFNENIALRAVRRVIPSTTEYDRAALTTRKDGRRVATPMLLVMFAIGTTDVIFALDSIPAIFGLTQESYLVFTANAFALMGLRQLFFIIGGLIDRLVYLSVGLAVILGFIGVKMILEALHREGVSWAPEIGIAVSLAVILGTLTVTTVASLVRSRRDASASSVGPVDGAVDAHEEVSAGAGRGGDSRSVG